MTSDTQVRTEAELRHRLFQTLDRTHGIIRSYPAVGDLMVVDEASLAAAGHQLEILAELLAEATLASQVLRDLTDLSIEGALIAGATDAALIVLSHTLATLSAQLDVAEEAA